MHLLTRQGTSGGGETPEAVAVPQLSSGVHRCELHVWLHRSPPHGWLLGLPPTWETGFPPSLKSLCPELPHDLRGAPRPTHAPQHPAQQGGSQKRVQTTGCLEGQESHKSDTGLNEGLGEPFAHRQWGPSTL